MERDKALAGKTALVTGGGGSIGSACAMELVRDGAAALLMGRRAEVLERARDRILAQVPGGRVEIHPGDAGNAADVAAAIDAAHAIQDSLDIVVTAVGGGVFRPVMMVDLDFFMEQFQYNFVTAFLPIRQSLPRMRRGGSIVAISSSAGGKVTPWMASYSAAKASLESLIRSIGEELGAAGIRANAVRPGVVQTELGEHESENPMVYNACIAETPLGRIGRPQDVASAVRYLAGPEADWVTGQVINVDGGSELRKNPPLLDVARAFFGDETMDAVLAGKEPDRAV